MMTVDRPMKPRIALTMGDPAGVGPEICLRALAAVELLHDCQIVVFGDAQVLLQCARVTGLPAPAHIETASTWLRSNAPACVVDLKCIAPDAFTVGRVAAATGQASYDYIDAAITAALAGEVDAVTTAPINKESFRAAGIHYPGHTEIFAERAGSDRWCMMQFSPELTCTFVTVHVGYAQVPNLLTTARVLQTIELTAEALAGIHGRPPRIVVCGLNPHAGEHGLFGEREEERFIIPAIEQACRQGLIVEGPLPPDTAFLPAKRRSTDGFVCMYHDQGHIPLKALAFDTAVNTTLGLKVIRTSVDHGTAYDIAWQGVASVSSLFAAIRLAIDLIKLRKRQNAP
jgi:4-phospho-D-threonate 3-dehydrogenase / 4-phospho-D-erythronate 3-dehydrogenase